MAEEKTFENMDILEKTSKENISTAIRDETREKSNSQLQEWYVNFIKLFREKFSTLSEEEKSCLNNTNNFLNPCQIEVFWIANPSLQLIILSNLSDRKDMEIHVNGPFTTNEFRDKVDLILQETRWNQPISDSFQVDLGSDHQYTYAERLAGQLHQFMEYSKYLLFNTVPFSGPGGGNGLNSKVWIEQYIGNIGEQSYENKVEQLITSLKSTAKHKQEEEIKKSQKNTSEQQEDNQIIKSEERKWDGFGVHLFPPYVVGKKSRPSVSELLYGSSGFNRREKVFDLKINDCKIIVNKDGLIFVEFENKADAVRVFNVVMALGVLKGFPLFAVRERDLSSANYDKDELTITEQQWHLQTIRTGLRDFNHPKDFYLGYQVKEIPIYQLRLMIQKAFEIDSNEKLTENLRLFTESFTHLENGEYAQSFIMSWSVVERKYSNMWKTTLDERDLDHERYAKLTNSAQWSFDYVVEALNLNGKIDDQEYDFLMELKRKRNKMYHSGKIVSHEDAKRCLGFITNILKNEMNISEQ